MDRWCEEPDNTTANHTILVPGSDRKGGYRLMSKLTAGKLRKDKISPIIYMMTVPAFVLFFAFHTFPGHPGYLLFLHQLERPESNL